MDFNVDEFIWRLRNNARKNNYKAVAQQVMDIIRKASPEDVGKPLHAINRTEEQKALIERIYVEFFQSIIENNNDRIQVPRQYAEMFLEFARMYRGDIEKQDRAREILHKIENINIAKVKKKVKRELAIMELINIFGHSDGEVIDENRVDGLLENAEITEETCMEILESLFGEGFSIDQLSLGELEARLKGKKREPKGNTTVDGIYPEDMRVDKRIKFFKENINLKPIVRFCTEGIFAGSIMLEIEGTDLMLVEGIFKIYRDDSYEYCEYKSATYLLPKKCAKELMEYSTRRQVKDKISSIDGGLKPFNHGSKWRENVLGAIENYSIKERNADVVHILNPLEIGNTTDAKVERETVPELENLNATEALDKIDLSTMPIEDLREYLEAERTKNQEKERKYLILSILEAQKRGKELDEKIAQAARSSVSFENK